jgi:hypothetical protein
MLGRGEEGSLRSTPTVSTPTSIASTPSGEEEGGGHGCSDARPLATLQQVALLLTTSAGAPALGQASAGLLLGKVEANSDLITATPKAAAVAVSECSSPRLSSAAMVPLRPQSQDDLLPLHEALMAARSQLTLLQRQLTALQHEAARQRQLAATRVMERECELHLARSEADAYRIASQARSSALATLQK